MTKAANFGEDAIASGKIMSWYDDATPEVSIVVLNYNKSHLTAECLLHIWKNTYGRRYEIIVVDNGSSAAEFNKLAELPGRFRLLRLPINRYFGEGNNIGVGISRGRYIVFLNNDAFVDDNWLEPLISVLESYPNAGGVGAKMLYPDGRVQEAGAFIDDQGRSIQRGKFYTLAPEDLETIDVVDYCSAACFATLRKTFDRVLGFDPIFEPAYYEDCDLCFKIASLGLLIYYCPRSVVYHVENATSSSFNLGLEGIIDINRKKFLARWGSYLSARANSDTATFTTPPSLTPIQHEHITAATKPIAVFYTPFDLLPGGGERYLLTAACALQDGHQVYVATDVRYSDYRLAYLARELSLDAARVSITTLLELPKLGPIDLFVHLGNSAFPGAPGQGRRNIYICQFPFPGSADDIANHWEKLKSYESIYVYSDFVRKVLRGKINIFQFDAQIDILAPPVPIGEASFTALPKPDRPIILNVGRFFTGGHNKRHDVLIEGMRLLADMGVDAELHLVGTLHPMPEHLRHFRNLCQQAEGLPVSLHANAAPDLVRRLYAQASVYWHAAGFEVDSRLNPEKCEHFGISVLEAMAAGSIAFVVANGGPSEFVRENDTGFQYHTIDELVAKTVAIINDSSRTAAIRERSMQEARKYSETKYITKWRELAATMS